MSAIENIKNSKSRLMRLSTEDKSLGTQGRFTIDLASSGGIMDNVKGYMVHSIQCPNVFDNIPTYANVLTLEKKTGPATYAVVIPNSYYIEADLVTALQTAINAAIPDSVVVALIGSNPVKKFQFTFTGDEYTLQTGGVASRLGLTTNTVCADGVACPLTYIPNLTGETEVYVHSTQLAPNNLVEGSGSFSVVDKLNLDQPYSATCYSSFDNPVTHFQKYYPFESLKTLRSIRITLRNRTGNILVLPPNYDFTMMLMIFYK